MEESENISQENETPPSDVPYEEVEIQEPDKVAAILAYVPFLCFYALFVRKDNKFALHHGKQGLALFILEIIALALRWDVLWNVVLIILAAVAIWSMVMALRGEEFQIPVLSDVLDKYFK